MAKFSIIDFDKEDLLLTDMEDIKGKSLPIIS